MKLEDQFKLGKLTHLMELEIYNAFGESHGYRCAFCGLGVLAGGLRQARKIAENSYGKCSSWRSES